MVDCTQAPVQVIDITGTDEDSVLSFPSIPRNPRIPEPYAHLRTMKSKLDLHPASVVVKKKRRDENGGRRWVRRMENASFVGNPHVVPATKIDQTISTPRIRATFPEPLPQCISRSTKAPSVSLPMRDPFSANAGRFSRSLKGIRRELRRSGVWTECLVRDVETELVSWLQEGGTMIAPDAQDLNALDFPGRPIRDTQVVWEVSRTPLRLVWRVNNDSFARYVVHCVARYHEVVSYSKDINNERLTYLLRPNVTRPDFHAPAGLDTPPVTDIDSPSVLDTESDFVSDRDTCSEAGSSDVEPRTGLDLLPSISEDSDTPYLLRSHPNAINIPPPPVARPDEAWSVIGDTDAEGDESCSDHGLAESVRALPTQQRPDPSLSRAISHISQAPLRFRGWGHSQARSSSSPSRSPARRPRRPDKRRVDLPSAKKSAPKSLYNYLYA